MEKILRKANHTKEKTFNCKSSFPGIGFPKTEFQNEKSKIPGFTKEWILINFRIKINFCVVWHSKKWQSLTVSVSVKPSFDWFSIAFPSIIWFPDSPQRFVGIWIWLYSILQSSKPELAPQLPPELNSMPGCFSTTNSQEPPFIPAV